MREILVKTLLEEKDKVFRCYYAANLPKKGNDRGGADGIGRMEQEHIRKDTCMSIGRK